MKTHENKTNLSRRDFIRKTIIGGCLLSIRPDRLILEMLSRESNSETAPFEYQYKTMSVKHFPELQAEFDKIKKSGQLSDHPIYRGYIDKLKFTVPPDFPDAQFVIVMAIFTPLMLVNFEYNGTPHELMMPPQYYDDGVTLESIENLIRNKIIGVPGYKIQRARGIFLKRLAVRSGLAKYGRNNISYVEGMGSFLSLYAYFTNYSFKEDNWTTVSLMDSCKECQICRSMCPNKCIRDDQFVIDAGRCVTLYNEVAGDFPDWIQPEAHNALMGCMRCQLYCPANAAVRKMTGRLADISAEETRSILEGRVDDALIKTLSRKLRDYYPATSRQDFPIFTRNLSVLLKRT